MLALTACSSDTSDYVPSHGEYDAILMLVMDDSGVSRSTPSDGEYNPGAGYENYIDIDGRDFRILFFDQQNYYIDSLSVTSVIPTDDNSSASASSKHYAVLGKIATDISRKNAKVMILANWRRSYPVDLVKGTTTIDEVCSSTSSVYGFSEDNMLVSPETPIPLFGIKDLGSFSWTDPSFGNNHAYNMGSIHMLRAYARIEIINASESELVDVKLHRYNALGFKAPAGVYKESDYVHGSWSQDYVATPHIPVQTAVEQPIALLSPDQTGNNWIAYVPEFDNLTNESSYLTVRFGDSDTEYRVDFRTDQDVPSTEFNLLRNNWYRFTLSHTELETEYTLKVEVDVTPYSTIDLDPVFGVEPNYDFPEELYIVGHLFNVPFDPAVGVKLTREPLTKTFYGDVEITGPFWFATGLNSELEPDRFYSHGNQFGTRYGATVSYNYGAYISQLDEPMPITLSGNTSKGYYKVVVDWDVMHVDLFEANPAMPDELYIVGNIAGEEFATDRGVRLTRDPGTDVFYGDVEITGEFWFAASISSDPEEFYAHGNQYGPGSNTLLTVERSLPININNSPGHFYFDTYPAGQIYHVVVNWDTMKVSADPAS
ncbi:MAG: hypothetical protein NC336_07480 [Clostridium sp.]|nr:hypothetical protein [Clostridium sp.]